MKAKTHTIELLEGTRLVCAGIALFASAGCLQPTPFGTEPEHRDLTSKNLAALAALPERSGPFKIAALGGTHDDYDRFARAVELINERGDIDLVLHGGDMSDLGLVRELEWTADILARLRMPFFAAIGNHDAISGGKAIYQKMFGPYDFTFTWSGAKFVVFNSNSLEFTGEAPDRAWLTAALTDLGDAERLIVLTHQPPHYPDDVPGGTAKEYYKNLLNTTAIDVYIHGHVQPWSLSTPTSKAPVLGLGAFEAIPYYTVITVSPEPSILRFERCELERCEEQLLPVSTQ